MGSQAEEDLFDIFMKHEKQHKKKPTYLSSVADGRRRRVEENLKKRKSKRLSGFDFGRTLEKSPTAPPKPLNDVQLKHEQRKLQLEKWKKEKEAKKKAEASKKKKPFVAGVAHNPLNYNPPPPPPTRVPSISGRVTRSQTARNDAKPSFAPKNAKFKAPQLNLEEFPKFQYPRTKGTQVTFDFNPVPTKTNSKGKATAKPTKILVTKESKPVKKLAPKTAKIETSKQQKKPATNKANKTEKNVPKSTESSVEEEVKPVRPTRKTYKVSRKSSPRRSNLEVTPKPQKPQILHPNRKSTPMQISERSTDESSKSQESEKSATKTPKPLRKSYSQPISISDSSFEQTESKISPRVTVSRGKPNARIEMKKKLDDGLLDEDACDMEAIHFRRQLDSEVARLNQLSEEWELFYEDTELPEHVQELVLGTVGQARLLVSSKLQQFAGLVSKCEQNDARHGLVTTTDLQGFWDMVFIQINNLYVRFKHLDELKSRNWVQEKPKEQKKKVVQKKKAKKSTAAPSGNSRLKEMIEAARKAKQAPSNESPSSLSENSEKTFEAGFFCVRSPVRSPASQCATPSNNLLKSVLSTEARKASANSSPASYAMLRASIIGKNIEIDGVAPLEKTPPHLTMSLKATPGRSILKSTRKSTSNKPLRKTVLFNDSDDENTSTETEPAPIKDNNNKENSRKSTLSRQEAVDMNTSIMTRSRRKSILDTPKENAKRSSLDHALKDIVINIMDETVTMTPKQTPKSRKKHEANSAPRRKSIRNKPSEDLIVFDSPAVKTKGRKKK